MVALAASVVIALRPGGVGIVRFGTPKARAVGELTRLFGAPTLREVSPGCGPRYTEVGWGGLSAEFRLGRFTGYRYTARRPALETAAGITIGSTLGQLRSAYGVLRFVGTDRWRSADGLVFRDDAEHDPEPPASRIVEIKTGTCGDY